MSPQSHSDSPVTIPGIKPRWPWLFALTGVPALLAAWVVWQQMDRIDRLRFENVDVRFAKDKLDAEVAELRKQKVDLEKRLTAAEETSKANDAKVGELQDDTKKLQKDAKKTQDELNALRANARPYVTSPLDAKVKSIVFLGTASWTIEWRLWVMNPSSEPIDVYMNVSCASSNDGTAVLNEWRGLKPVTVEATKARFMTDSISLDIRHCVDGTRSKIVAFAKLSNASVIPIDVWPHGAD